MNREQEKIAVEYDLARKDLYFFTRYTFAKKRGYKWLNAKHHKLICNALMNVFLGKTKRLIINIPPRYSKTEIAVVNFVAWCFGQVPDCEFIHASYSSTLAVTNSSNIRALIQHETYQAIFPNVTLNSEAKNHWTTSQGGVFYATGAGGTITGFGAGKHRSGFGGAIIIDDPHKADEATSDVMRQNVIDWFQNTVESRKNDPKNTPIIVIMQRLHENDLSGWLLNGGNGEEWEHLCLPAIREDGSALWEEKHTIEQLRQMERANAYVFAGQYMQRPTILGGGVIKGLWFTRYKIPPIIKLKYIYADTAQKTKQHNDYSVFLIAGKGLDGRVYILDVVRGKWEAPELERTLIDVWSKHKSHTETGILAGAKVEDKASGTGLIQAIKRKNQIPIKAVQVENDKYTRVLGVQGYIESGYVCLPENAHWVADFINECEAFTPTNSHQHDDQVDALVMAISDLLGKPTSLLDC